MEVRYIKSLNNNKRKNRPSKCRAMRSIKILAPLTAAARRELFCSLVCRRGVVSLFKNHVRSRSNIAPDGGRALSVPIRVDLFHRFAI
ncbi:hypothetical protein EVAR_37842_1 [Eumeta japonica]|uniref:Uncharacterized protein n=1 Tax=Eumeta variegata TaxID=151549 RepID=A0A4C1X1X2_EUMVA|nr:hypothetical protein EVAR_37842_1 [Eumeta japonica]